MTSAVPQPQGRICTFYSYKGGVGRSMALANVAVLMAQWGFRVLAVDWDLEAPGLDRYFQDLRPAGAKLTHDGDGIVELARAASEDRELDWRDSVVTFSVPGATNGLEYISAGRADSGYVERLQKLDWEGLFRDHNFGARLEAIRNDWPRTYDHVLIDSRTGITDIGGICTIYLPDTLVALFTANHQSVEGVADVIRRARRARSELPSDRGALTCVPVPARDESRNEYEQSVEWRARYETMLGSFYADFLPRDISASDALAVLRIPNVPYWSFGERLPVLTESPLDGNGITYYYTILAKLLASELSWPDSVPPYSSSSREEVESVTVPIVSVHSGRKSVAEEIDLAFLIELGGEQTEVDSRIRLVRSVIDTLADSYPISEVRASVLGYREHHARFSLRARDDRNKLIVGRDFGSLDAALDELSQDEIWRAVPVENGLAAPIEDALVELAEAAGWRQNARRVLVVVGERPPHPPVVEPDGGFVTPCPNGLSWQVALLEMTRERSVMRLAVRGARLSRSIYEARCWERLGAHGLFIGYDSLEFLLHAIVGPEELQTLTETETIR